MSTSCTAIAGVAEHLLTEKTGEEFLRSAASRHFYAAMHHCREWEKKLPAVGSEIGARAGTHSRLIARLQNPDSSCSVAQNKKSRHLAYFLKTMKRVREVADYDIGESFTLQEANQQKADALLILEG